MESPNKMIDRLITWTLVGLLTGLLVGEYRVRTTLNRLWEDRHKEAVMRQDVLDRALTLATETKWDARNRKVEAIRQLHDKNAK